VIERQTQIVTESVKIEQLTKIDFFEDLLLLKSKTTKLMKVWKEPGAYAQEIADQKDVLRIFTNFLRCSTNICFSTTTSPNLTSLKLEVLLGTTMK
jgi:hypothetical protein